MIRIKKFRASILMSLFSVAFLSVRQTGGAEGKSRTVESQIPTSLERAASPPRRGPVRLFNQAGRREMLRSSRATGKEAVRSPNPRGGL